MPGSEPAQAQVGIGRPSSGTAAGTARRTRPKGSGEWDVLAAISVGGGLGSVARYGLARAWPTPVGGFPWATFLTNLLGSLALGVLMVYVVEVWPPSRYRRPFLGVGVIGGFTTFSTYVFEMRGLIATHHLALADAYALSSLLAGLAAVWTAIVLARRVSRLPVRRGPTRRGRNGAPVVLPGPPDRLPPGEGDQR